MTLRTIKRTATALILSSMLALVIACAGEAETIIVEKEVVKTVEVPVEKIVEVEKIESGHPSFNPASSSPATDGERVVAYFGSYGVLCFDMDGEKLWEIKMPLTQSYAGNATSPAIYGDSVILYRGNHVDHFLIAVDKHTGKDLRLLNI